MQQVPKSEIDNRVTKRVSLSTIHSQTKILVIKEKQHTGDLDEQELEFRFRNSSN